MEDKRNGNSLIVYKQAVKVNIINIDNLISFCVKNGILKFLVDKKALRVYTINVNTAMVL